MSGTTGYPSRLQRSTADELALLRRLAIVARQMLDAERAFNNARRGGDASSELLTLRDFKHQLRRLVTEHEERHAHRRPHAGHR